MKFNSISLKFSDLDEETARLEIVLDPPLPEGQQYSEADFEEQPCMGLAHRVMNFLNWVREQEGIKDGGQGSNVQIIH
jgi:hypothetical protein